MKEGCKPISNQLSQQAKPSKEPRHRPITHVAPKGKSELNKQLKSINIIKNCEQRFSTWDSIEELRRIRVI